MIKVRPGQEVEIRTKNEVGAMAQLAKVLAEKGVDILATVGWVEGDQGVIRLVTDDNVRAADALREKNYAPTETHVVLAEVQHKPGMLRTVCEKLAQGGIDIRYMYASSPVGVGQCLLVLSTSNNDRAVVLLNE